MAAKSQTGLVALDLFSGIGGIALGMEMAGIPSALAVDSDPHAVETFDHNFSHTGARCLLGDLEDTDLLRTTVSAARKAGVNVVVGGPPCQGFSQVGNHRDLENDPRNHLYKRFVQIVREIKPRAFVMENVPGLAQRLGGRVLEQIRRSLTLDGAYDVMAGVLDAADFGVPQSRQRVIFLGIDTRERVGAVLPRPPARFLQSVVLERTPRRGGYTYELRGVLSSGQPSLFEQGADPLEALLDPEDLTFVTVEQALGDLEHLAPNPTLKQQQGDDWGQYAKPPATAYQRLMRKFVTGAFYNAQVPFMWEDTRARLREIPPGGNYRDLPADLQRRYLNGQKWGPESGRDSLSRKYFFAYRRLHPHFVSWTLNTKADCIYHYDGTRALSVREFARLSSFPDHFSIHGPDKHTRYRLVGNAVPPLLGAALGRQLVSLLCHRSQKRRVAGSASGRGGRIVARDLVEEGL